MTDQEILMIPCLTVRLGKDINVGKMFVLSECEGLNSFQWVLKEAISANPFMHNVEKWPDILKQS